MHVVLVRPEIAPNTGNVIRLCANTGATLHLVGPLGFSLDDRLLRRAGLDYRDRAVVETHEDLDAVAAVLDGRWFAFTSSATRRYSDVEYRDDDVLVFGAERAGLTEAVLERFDPDHRLAIPMRPDNRSLNLANAVAVVVYEAWRQSSFSGADHRTGSTTAETPAAEPFDR